MILKIQTYNKEFEEERFKKGDLVSLVPNTSYVTRSKDRSYNDRDKFVVGICTSDNGKTVDVTSEGILDVNVTGLICIGDRLTTSNIAGKAKAIRNDVDGIRVFEIKPIGKVITLYNDYSIAKVLLDIE